MSRKTVAFRRKLGQSASSARTHPIDALIPRHKVVGEGRKRVHDGEKFTSPKPSHLVVTFPMSEMKEDILIRNSVRPFRGGRYQ